MKNLSLTLILVIILVNLLASGCYAEQNSQLRSKYQKDIRIIIQNPKFHPGDPFAWLKKTLKWAFSPLKSFINWIKYILGKIIPPKNHLPQVDIPHEILKWLGIGLAIGLPFFLVYNWRRIFQKESITFQHPKTDAMIRKMEPQKIVDRAALLAEQGEFREAIRFLYIGCLERLKNNGILPEGIILSDNENLKTARRVWGLYSETYKAFRELVVLFQEKWYGLKPCTIDDYHRSHKLLLTIGIKR